MSPNRNRNDARARRIATTTALLLAACACPSAWAADAPTILPPAPQAFEPVTARLALPLCVDMKGVQLVDGVFEIEVGTDEACPSPPPPPVGNVPGPLSSFPGGAVSTPTGPEVFGDETGTNVPIDKSGPRFPAFDGVFIPPPTTPPGPPAPPGGGLPPIP